MVLTDTQILSYIQNPNNDSMADYVKSHDKLNMFANGKGIEDYIIQIQGLETKDKAELRKRFARSTKDVISKILRPTDKVYSAKGGSFELVIENDTQKKELEQAMDNIAEGMSKRKWLETYALDGYHVDPNGIIFVEIPKSDSKNRMPYPTYKNIKSIHDYKAKGQTVEYVIFQPRAVTVGGNLRKVYRVVDDVKDALYYIDTNQALKIHNTTDEIGYLRNTYGKVPAFTISNIVDKNTGGKKSMLEPITELLAEYLQDTSVKSIYKFLHGYPFFWRFVADCKACEGEGYTEDGDQNTKSCNVCGGTGKNLKKDVSDTFDMQLPTDKEDAILKVAEYRPAGYVEPSVNSWKQMTEEQLLMIDLMVKSFWGTSLDERYDRETATGRTIDTQPIADKLNKYADWAEKIDKTLTDIIGGIKYGENYKGSFIFYGRRFLIESPEQIWKKYVDARKLGAPDSALTQILIQYYHSEYQNDSVMLNRALKMLQIEPYPHIDFKTLTGVATDKQKQLKLAFSEWSRGNVDDSKEVDVLKAEFETFAATKFEKEEEKVEPNINLKQEVA